MSEICVESGGNVQMPREFHGPFILRYNAKDDLRLRNQYSIAYAVIMLENGRKTCVQVCCRIVDIVDIKESTTCLDVFNVGAFMNTGFGLHGENTITRICGKYISDPS